MISVTKNISARLKEISEYISPDDRVADIGSDHGYLLLLLLDKGCKRLLGIENKNGPFLHLKENLNQYLNDKIEVSFSDGLSYLPADINTLAFAGMGGKNIISILSNNESKLEQIEKIVVSPHIDIPALRRYLTGKGYYIESEDIIFDEKYYFVDVFKKGSKTYTDEEIYFGPILLSAQPYLFRKYYQELADHYRHLLLTAHLDSVRKKELNDKISYIKEYVREK